MLSSSVSNSRVFNWSVCNCSVSNSSVSNWSVSKFKYIQICVRQNSSMSIYHTQCRTPSRQTTPTTFSQPLYRRKAASHIPSIQCLRTSRLQSFEYSNPFEHSLPHPKNPKHQQNTRTQGKVLNVLKLFLVYTLYSRFPKCPPTHPTPLKKTLLYASLPPSDSSPFRPFPPLARCDCVFYTVHVSVVQPSKLPWLFAECVARLYIQPKRCARSMQV
jgi:hypothetical protein